MVGQDEGAWQDSAQQECGDTAGPNKGTRRAKRRDTARKNEGTQQRNEGARQGRTKEHGRAPYLKALQRGEVTGEKTDAKYTAC